MVLVSPAQVICELFVGISHRRNFTFRSSPSIDNGFFILQIIGHWFEVEKSFNFPEIATGCTTMQFTSEAMQKNPNLVMPRLEVAVKNINEW